MLAQAVNPDTAADWPPARIEGALRATDYYKQTPKSRRDWDVLVAQDPATATEKFNKAKQQVDDAMRQTGVLLQGGSGWDLFSSPHWRMIEDAAMNGWSDQEVHYQVSLRGPYAQYGGEEQQNAAQARKIADDYGVPLSDFAANTWGKQLSKGFDVKTLQGAFMEQAKSLYPGITSMLDRGLSVRQIADPYLQIAQQELGVDTDTISLTDSKWNKAINNVDPATGNRVSMSLSDWTKNVRSDPVYGYDRTDKAKNAAADFSTKISQMFGAVG